MINGIKFCMITADNRCGEYREMMSDFWNMYVWILIFEGYHYSFDYIKEHIDELKDYDIVVVSGHDGYLLEILEIAEKYKGTKTKIVFFPEGDVSLYNDRGVSPIVCQVLNACSLVGAVEEDKLSFYRTVTASHVFFMHIPVPQFMVNGAFYVGCAAKEDYILVYGDNNPNNPIVAIGIAKRMKKPISVTGLSRENVEFVRRYLGVTVVRPSLTLGQAIYLRHFVGRAKLIIYPTRWIGTGRQMISGALCGTPVIGSRDSHTQIRLWPKLARYMYDVDGMCELVDRLYKDGNFYRTVCSYAFEKVEYYSEINAIGRLLKAYKEVGGKNG